jgi:hypothetical protein
LLTISAARVLVFGEAELISKKKTDGLQIRLCVARDIEHGVGGYGGDDDIGVARRFRRVSCGDNTGLSRALSERASIEEDVVGQNRNIAARQKLACECLADFAIADECKSHRNPHTRSLRGAKRRRSSANASYYEALTLDCFAALAMTQFADYADRYSLVMTNSR